MDGRNLPLRSHAPSPETDDVLRRAITARSLAGFFARLAVAAGAVVLAALIRSAFAPWLHEHSHYLFFAAAVLAAGVFAGTRAAILAALLSAVAVMLAGWARLPEGLAEMLGFAATSAVIIGVVHHIARLRSRAQARAEQAAGLADELNLLLDGASDYAIYMLDPKGRVTLWNSAAERMKGWREAEVVGHDTAMFYPAAAVADGKPQRDLDRARAEGRFTEEDWRLRKNGSEFFAHVTITALHDKSGDLRGFGKVIRDITAERAAERRLQENFNQFQSILATVPDAMIVIDEEGRVLSFSAAAERLFGYTESEMLGTNVSRLMPSPEQEQHDDYIRQYLLTGVKRIIGIGRTVTGKRADGSTFPMELAVGEAITEGARVFTGFIRDLTDKQEAEARIDALRQELIHAARLSAMGTMASTLAHEINQPITAVVSYVRGARNLLGGENPDADDRAMIEEALDLATEEAMRAGGIVRRLREFVARGDLEKSVEDLPALVAEAGKLALIGAREKGVEERFDIDPAASPVLADKVQVQQVLINLMRNAIEAMADSPERVLTVSTAIQDAEFVRVTVADTGPGVAPEIAADLFRAFNSSKTDGMGLGLSICRTIVEANGGRIWMEPGVHGGAVFHFTLTRATEDMLE
ncbi:PAS domain S-box protein [Sphingosinithalassobacter tenebrarum]|uniref:Sensor protein FixL n=1 Tax=Stakelama tenebrarum TaxID=2711215 RepID=A0A6G6Y4H7_9SPHN|nr:PAS domain S-box protein [Sphingosinithalassobacter tenebrarum]